VAIFLGLSATAFCVATIVLAVDKASLENDLQDARDKIEVLTGTTTTSNPNTTPSDGTATTPSDGTTPSGGTTSGGEPTPSGETTSSTETSPGSSTSNPNPIFPTLPTGLPQPEDVSAIFMSNKNMQPIVKAATPPIHTSKFNYFCIIILARLLIIDF